MSAGAVADDTGRATILNGFTFYIVVVYLPDRFQIVGGDSPVTAGLRLLPLLAGSAIGTSLAGGLSSRRNLTAYTLVVPSALQIVGYGLMTTPSPLTGAPDAVYGYQILLGVGFGAHIASTMLNVVFRYFSQPEHTGTFAFNLTSKADADIRVSCDVRLSNIATNSRRLPWNSRWEHSFQPADQDFSITRFRAEPRPESELVRVTTHHLDVATKSTGASGV